MSVYRVPGYDKNKDYSEEIARYAGAGDFASAAKAEEARNRKIAGEGLNYPKTYDYIDIGNKIRAGIENGAEASEIGELLEARRNKANTNPAYSKFKNDDIQKRGARYYYNLVNGVGANYENRPKYTAKYESKLDEMLDRVLNGEEFSYNPESDPAYRAYRTQYEREGNRAMRDTLATLASSAGGMNSNAVSAASQANNYYMQQLTDKIPELYSMAYEMYRNKRNENYQNAALLSELDNNDFSRYLNNMNIYQNDMQRAEDMYSNQYAREQADEEWRYGLEQDAKTENSTRLWQLLQSGIVPTDEAIEAAGFTPEQMKVIADIYASEIADNQKLRGLNMQEMSKNMQAQDMAMRNDALDYEIRNFQYEQMKKEAAGLSGGSSGSSSGSSSGGSSGSSSGSSSRSSSGGSSRAKSSGSTNNNTSVSNLSTSDKPVEISEKELNEIVDSINGAYIAYGVKDSTGKARRQNMRLANDNNATPPVDSSEKGKYTVKSGREREVILRVMNNNSLGWNEKVSALNKLGITEKDIENSL